MHTPRSKPTRAPCGNFELYDASAHAHMHPHRHLLVVLRHGFTPPRRQWVLRRFGCPRTHTKRVARLSSTLDTQNTHIYTRKGGTAIRPCLPGTHWDGARPYDPESHGVGRLIGPHVNSLCRVHDAPRGSRSLSKVRKMTRTGALHAREDWAYRAMGREFMCLGWRGASTLHRARTPSQDHSLRGITSRRGVVFPR